MSSRALLILDPQQGWVHESVNKVFERIPSYANKFDGHVIICKFVNKQDSPFVEFLNWERFIDDEDTRLLVGYEQLTEQIFERTTYDCLQPDLIEFLEAKSIQSIYLSGIFTDVSVAATAMSAFDRGYETFVVTDLVNTLHGQKIHEMTLKSLGFSIGQRHSIAADDLPTK
jgi:nicotinamidase-related amidase